MADAYNTSQYRQQDAYVRGAAPHNVDMTMRSEKYDYDDYNDSKRGQDYPLHDDDEYEDVYGSYTLPKVSPPPHSAARSPYYTQPNTNGDHLHRNVSDSSQMMNTASSPWKKWTSTRSNIDTQSDSKSRHLAGAPSISRHTIPLSSPAAKRFGWMPQTWATRLFLLITLAEAAADISIETVLFTRFREQQGTIKGADGNYSALPVFLMAFGMAHIYQCFLAVDAVVNRNTILVFGLVVFNLAFLIYAIIQIGEIRGVLGDGVIQGTSQVVPVQILTGAIPVIIGCSSAVFTVLAWFLWKDFGWQIYKVIGADRNLKKAHMHYQIFVCLLKFDFFTFIAYCLQLVLVVLRKDTAERWVTIFASPVAFVLLFFAWYSVRKELKWGMAIFMFGLVGGAGYFSYKMYKIWMERTTEYLEVYKSLTVFTVLALCLLVATFIMSVRCLMNFDMGLKGAMTRSEEEKRLAREAGNDPGSINISRPLQSSPSYSDHKLHFRKPSKGMLPLQSASSLHVERRNPRLSLD